MKKKTKKPRWTHLSLDGTCPIRADECYGIKTIRIKGYPIKEKRIKYLAKWFTAAAAWLKQEGE